MSGRSLLILGELGEDLQKVIESECRSIGFAPKRATNVETAAAELSSQTFDAFLIQLSMPGAARVCLKARGKLARGRFPIIALGEDADDTAFERAFRAGADDLVHLVSPRALSLRLAELPPLSTLPIGRPRGEALIVDPDRARAEVLERALADAGFRVETVKDELAAKLHLGRPHVKLVVVDPNLGNTAALFEHSRKKGSRSVWVVRARPEKHPDILRAFQPGDPVSVISAFGPPDDILFEANRLLDDSGKEARADPRLLYATTVTIHRPDTDVEDRGYSYNVSSAGLYVRTLAPPRSDGVELKLRAPNGDKALSLHGKVVWRRAFGPTQKESAPPGFGVQLVSGELTEWAEAFRRYHAERQGVPAAAETDLRSSSIKPLRKPSRPSMAATKPGPAGAAAGSLKKTMVGVAPPVGAPQSPPLPKRNLARTALGISPPEAPKTPKPEQQKSPGSPHREPLSSVEEMLSDALGEGAPPTQGPGSVPLTIAGDFKIDESGGGAIVQSEPLDDHRAPTAPPDRELESIPPNALASEPPDAPDRASDSARESGAAPAAEKTAASDPPSPGEAAFDTTASNQDRPEGAPPEPIARAVPPARSPEAAPRPVPQAETPAVDPALARTVVAQAVAPTRPAQPDEAPAELDALPMNKTARTGTVLAVLAVLAGLIGGGVFALRANAPSEAAPTETHREPAPTPLPVDPATPEPTAAEQAGSEVTAAPAPSTEEAPAASERPAEEPRADVQPEPDTPEAPSAEPSEIPPGMAHLFVASELDTNVFVHGKMIGKTNTVLVSHCGTRFVRLGTAPGEWQTEGTVIKIKCGERNDLDLR